MKCQSVTKWLAIGILKLISIVSYNVCAEEVVKILESENCYLFRDLLLRNNMAMDVRSLLGGPMILDSLAVNNKKLLVCKEIYR